MHRGRAVQKALKLRSSQQLLDEEDDDFQRPQQVTQQNKRTKSPVLTPRRNFVPQLDDDPPLELNDRTRTTRTTYPQSQVPSRKQENGRQRQAAVPRKRPNYEDDLEDDPPFVESQPARAPPVRRTAPLPALYVDDMYENPPLPSQEELQERLDRLFRIRYTEPEALCKRIEEAADRQSKDSDALIQRMQLELENKDKELEDKDKENLEMKQRYEQLLNTEKEQYASEIAVLKATVDRLKAQRPELLESRPKQSEITLKDTVDTYVDMTGMIITDVKRTSEGYMYSCVQNGSQGSMHFKLIRRDDGRTREYLYEPILDAARDRAILDQLAGRMSHEVSFRQDQAPIFHCKLAYSLLQKKE